MKHTYITLGLFTALFGSSCKKFTEIGPPLNGITTTQAFSTNASATLAIEGIYATLNSSQFGQGYMSAYPGMSADELTDFNAGTAELQLTNNNLTANNADVLSIWTSAYKVIGQANACIAGLNASTGVTDSARTLLLGEARFLRAYSYFYLTALFGDVPLDTLTDWQQTNQISRTPQSQVYNSVMTDLAFSRATLPSTYSSGNVLRASRWAAIALQARVALYEKQWANAEAFADTVLSGAGPYSATLGDPNGVFLINSSEAIWQLQPPSYVSNTFEATLMAGFGTPAYIVTDSLLAAFEPGDLRFTDWLDSMSYNGQTYYYAYKYKANTYNPPALEYEMMLRVGEQYLIRAEARAQQGNVASAVNDLNTIRTRAGLTALSPTLSQTACLQAVVQERRIELFAEWGHRWLDLVRMDLANTVLASEKSGWTINAVLYPIPASELQADTHLTQNAGY